MGEMKKVLILADDDCGIFDGVGPDFPIGRIRRADLKDVPAVDTPSREEASKRRGKLVIDQKCHKA